MSKRTILLVDDDRDYVDIVERAVEREHLEVEMKIARTGPEALEKLGLTKTRMEGLRPEYAALFVDLSLPGLDGWEVLRRVRADVELRQLPVIVVSSSARAADVNRSYDMGANSYVVKRYDPSGPGRYLAQAMQYWLDLNRAATVAARKAP